jgi:hypothetical protein
MMASGKFGGPTNIFEYTKTCNSDYPSRIDTYNKWQADDITLYAGNTDDEKKNFMRTYDAKTGEIYYPNGYGDYTKKSYCDGGASTLVAATAAALAVTVSLH